MGRWATALRIADTCQSVFLIADPESSCECSFLSSPDALLVPRCVCFVHPPVCVAVAAIEITVLILQVPARPFLPVTVLTNEPSYFPLFPVFMCSLTMFLKGSVCGWASYRSMQSASPDPRGPSLVNECSVLCVLFKAIAASAAKTSKSRQMKQEKFPSHLCHSLELVFLVEWLLEFGS